MPPTFRNIAAKIKMNLPILKITDSDLGLCTYYLYILLGQHAASRQPLPEPSNLNVKSFLSEKYKFPDLF